MIAIGSSLNKVIKVLELICGAHQMAPSFGYGMLSDFNASNDVTFPAIWVEPTETRVINSTQGVKVANISLNIYALDRIDKGDSNFLDIHSDMDYLLKTIIGFIRESDYTRDQYITLDSQDQVSQFITRETDENCNGVMMSLVFRLPDVYTPCNSPFEGITASFPTFLPQSMSGVQGPQGPTGADGSQGIDGATGSQGPQGFQGPTGGDGHQGIDGATGSNGSNTLVWLNGTPTNLGYWVGSSSQAININTLFFNNVDFYGLNVSTWLNGISINDIIEITDLSDHRVFGIYNVTSYISTADPFIVGVGLMTGTGSFVVGKQFAISYSKSGPQGYQGPTGPQGFQGPTGNDGSQGINGATGSQGPQGFQGPQGIQGASASAVLGSIQFLFDGMGGVITTNTRATVVCPYSGTITGWQIFEWSNTPISSTVSCDVWEDTYTNYQPTVADTIFTTKPTLGGQTKNQNLSPTFTGLGATVSIGNVFICNVDSCISAQRILVNLFVTKTS